MKCRDVTVTIQEVVDKSRIKYRDPIANVMMVNHSSSAMELSKDKEKERDEEMKVDIFKNRSHGDVTCFIKEERKVVLRYKYMKHMLLVLFKDLENEHNKKRSFTKKRWKPIMLFRRHPFKKKTSQSFC